MDPVDSNGYINMTFQADPEPGTLTDVEVMNEKNSMHKLSSNGRQSYQTPAVVVKNACKQYSKKKGANPILKDFNMTVEQGTIYSLLGASGCGKTTILSCVVGLRQLDGGEILIYGAKPGTRASGVPGKRVGYMPQEIALYGEFTIKEILQYFGRIYGMTSAEVKENTEFLISFLNLPPAHRRIMTLSGGQQRRVSFAVALVHNPELLILDEPTVGVDPLLRQSIWSHLCKLVSSGRTTVIITTHYIEEARDSDRIGLMRNGKLLAEDSPTTLLEQYNTHLLEDIVLKLCLKDNADNSGENSETVSENGEIIAETPPQPVSIPLPMRLVSQIALGGTTNAIAKPGDQQVVVHKYTKRQSSVQSMMASGAIDNKKRMSLAEVLHRPSSAGIMLNHKASKKEAAKELLHRLYALSVKNVLVLLRNLTFLFFILIVPATQVVLICLAIGSDPKGIKLGLLNYDMPFGEICDNRTAGAGCIMQDEFNGSLSCQFILSLNQDAFDLISYESEEAALEDVRQTKIWGYMKFNENFTQSMKDRALFGAHAELETIRGSQIAFKLDMSNKQVAIQMKKIIFETFQRFMHRVAGACNIDPANLDTPLHFDTPEFGTDDTSFTEFIAPGVLLGIVFFFPLCASGVSMISEKKSGALDRTMVAGVTAVEVMVAYSLAQFVLLIFQSGLAFAIMVLVFNIQVHGHLALALAISVLIGVAGISVGFMMATICNDELEAVLLAMGGFFPNFILSGMFWPLEGMPLYLQYISYVLPCTLAGETLRSLVSRGVEFTHPAVWPGFVSTIVWIGIYWCITVAAHKFSKKK